MISPDDHWDHLYATKSSTELSWYERHPTASLRLIGTYAASPSDRVIDVGAGTSNLVDELVERGYLDVTVLDISSSALGEVRTAVGDSPQDAYATFERAITVFDAEAAAAAEPSAGVKIR